MIFGKKLISVLFLFALSCHLHAQTKIAVIADKGLENYADLLTVELSKQKDLNVIERAEIDKVLKEQEISSANFAGSYLKLGKLLKADGLVMIRKFEFQKKEFLVSRLVAVNQGVVLSIFSNPLPPEKIENWPADISAKFAPYLNKLCVSQDKAVPISILNIRAPIDTPEMRLLEKEFTLALAFRLVQEKDLFVLERWKMEKLAWEKDIDTESSPFWTGSYLLDGSIEFFEKENVKVKARVRKAGGEEKIIEAIGNRQQMSEITEKITAELLKNIGKTQDKIPWDSAKEAEQYLKESEWAFNSGLFEASLSAVQAAKALGNKSESSCFLEVKASSNCAYPARKPETWIKINLGYEPKLIDVTKDSNCLDNALLSMELLKANILSKVPESGQRFSNEKKWRETAERTILNSSIVLRGYYDQGCLTKDKEKAALLRKMLRDTYPIVAGRYFNYGLPTSIFELKAAYAPFWNEKPEETLKAYMELLCNENILDTKQYFYEIQRDLIFKSVLTEMVMLRAPAQQGLRMKRLDDPSRTPFLIDWSGKLDKESLKKMWDGFVEELCNSGNIRARYSGLYIKAWLHNLSHPNESNRTMIELMDMCWNERMNIIGGKSGIAVFSLDGFNIAPADKEFSCQYLLKYLKFLLEESTSRKIAKHSRNLSDVFCAWIKDSNLSDANEVSILLEKYRNAVGGLIKERRIYDFTITYNTDLLKKYPNLGKQGMDKLSVTRIWNPYESPDSREFSGFQIHGLSGTPSRIYLLCSYASKGMPVFRIVSIKAEGLSSDSVEVPYKCNKSCISAMDASDSYLAVVVDKNKALSYEFKLGQWREHSVPEKKYSFARVIGTKALLSFNPSTSGDEDSGIVIIDMGSGNSTILASSKRNPSESPLDNVPPYKTEDILEILPGTALVAVTLKDKPYFPKLLSYEIPTGKWKDFNPGGEESKDIFHARIALDFYAEGGDSYGKYTYGGFMVPISDLEYRKTIFLHYNSEKELPVIFKNLSGWRSSGRYLKPANKYLCYDGKNAYYYTESPEKPVGKHLIAFQEKAPAGIPIPLDFSMTENDFELMNGKNKGIDRNEVFSNNSISSNCLWLKGKGFFIKSCDLKVLWFIPQADMDGYIAKHGINDLKSGQ
ncbi:MAG TPA: hypothetical protein DET40_15695 [Lentisphaeria bacterium]|nr:MAG: hypothetical protein A2X45_14220 [Lentisphaerae bacterium GWF2_50_93]HCE44983.1 hypothetical protein [Lentisphaeria bacterium]